MIATAYAGGLTTDAPSDGQMYGRQNGAWQNFAPGGPYLPLSAAVAGWGTPTNGVRGSFDASIAGLLETAQKLAQLIADLKTVGVIKT